MAWLLLGIIIWAALMFLVTPLLRKAPRQSENAHEIRAYKDEIDRLTSEIEAGGLPELASRKIELQRQLLGLTSQTDMENQGPSYMVINSLFAFFVFGGIGLYTLLGSPELTKQGALKAPVLDAEQALSQSASPQHDNKASLDTLLGQLKSKLDDERKDDPDGWMLYARTLMNLGRFDEAFGAYERALALTDNNPNVAEELSRAKEFAAQRSQSLESQGAASIPQTPRGPSAEDVEDAASMSAEDRSAMIENMVTRLATRMRDNPDNPEGWISAPSLTQGSGADGRGKDRYCPHKRNLHRPPRTRRANFNASRLGRVKNL